MTGHAPGGDGYWYALTRRLYMNCDVACTGGTHQPPGWLMPISRCGPLELPTMPQPMWVIG